jgi:hypothetical protein
MVIEEPSTHTINVGQRVLADCRRRINELERRAPFVLTKAERSELHRLRVFVHLSRMGGEDA